MRVIGIDLGTAFSAAAYVDDQGNFVIVRTTSSPDTMLPSAVLFHGDSVLVGDPAINAFITDESHVVRWVKRAIGDPDYQYPRRLLFQLPAALILDVDGQAPDPDAPLDARPQPVPASAALRDEFRKAGFILDDDARSVPLMRGARRILHSGAKAFVILDEAGATNVYQGMSAIEISAEILKALKSCAEAQLGEPVKDAVITFPAYFNDNEIRNTRLAGELAGLKVHRTIEEPVAAAVYFGVKQMKDGEKTLVCDLGGGTFDATVLQRTGDKFDPLSTMGDRTLGGHDWTMELMDHAGEQFQAAYGVDPRGDLVLKQALYEACEAAKKSFSQLAEVQISCAINGAMRQISVARSTFESVTEHLIDRMVGRCDTSLQKIGMAWSDLDRILLVGGSSRLRRVSESIEQRAGKKPEMSQTPDLMVVYGAAIIAKGSVTRRVRGVLEEFAPQVTSRIPRSLGIQVLDDSQNPPRIVNSLLIEKNTEVPVSKSKADFVIAANGQVDFDIPIVEFENDAEFDRIANFRAVCLPGSRRDQRVRIDFKYGDNRELSVDAHDVASGARLDVKRESFRDPSDIPPPVEHWIVFAIDTSGSMQGGKLRAAKEMLIEQVSKLLGGDRAHCRVGVVSFNTTASVVANPTDRESDIIGPVERMDATGTTAMDDGEREAMRLLDLAPPGAARTIAMLTDGMPDKDRRESTARVSREIRDKGISLVILGITGGDVDIDFLRSLSPDAALRRPDDLNAGMATLLKLGTT